MAIIEKDSDSVRIASAAMGLISLQASLPKTANRTHTLSDILFYVVTPFLFLRHLLTAKPQILAAGSREIDPVNSLAVVGWLVLATLVLLALRSRRDARGRRIFAIALALALLHSVRMVWPNTNLDGALTAATPLFLVWPFVTEAIPTRTANYILVGTFYVIVLLFLAAWRLSQQAELIALPVDLAFFWAALTIFTTAFGQFLLGRQRLWPLRFAMLMLATGAVFAALDSAIGEAISLVLVLLLVLAQFLDSVWIVKSPPDMASVAQEKPRQLPQTTPQPGYLYEKRQLLSMRLATIVADRLSAGPAKLEAMLEVVTSVMEVDVAYVFQVRKDPVLSLVATARSGFPPQDAWNHQAALTDSNAPVLLHALRYDQTLIFSQTTWGESPSLDILYQSLGESSPGPTIVQPISRGNQGFGLVIVGNPGSKRAFADEESRLGQVAAVRIAAGIARQGNAESIGLLPTPPLTDTATSGTNTNPTAFTAAA